LQIIPNIFYGLYTTIKSRIDSRFSVI